MNKVQLKLRISLDIPQSKSAKTCRITDEALVPWTGAFPRDYSRYRSRYPLWAHFAQWNPGASDFAMMGQVCSACHSRFRAEQK